VKNEFNATHLEEQPQRLRCLIVVCTYNERDNLPSLIEAINQHAPEGDILVVDDNSPDGTGKWATEECENNTRLKVLQRSGKLGLGSAIRTGLKYGLDHNYDRIVNLDADFSHDPATIPALLERTMRSEKPWDVAIGSRYVAGGKISGLSYLRRCMSRAINAYARLLLGLKVGDWSSSFRVYNAGSLKRLKWEELVCDGYGSLQELLWNLHSTGAVIGEIPIHYINRRHGKSKISWQDAQGALFTLHRLAFQRRFAKK